MCKLRSISWLAISLVLAPACHDKELDASDPAAAGEACEPGDDGDPRCAEGLVCDPSSAGGYVCGAPLEIRGQVIDALDGTPIADAVVAALDDTGAPTGDAARSDADGNYVLHVTALRDPDGELADLLRWTLFAVADDYAPFPGGVRTALPIDASVAMPQTDDDDHVRQVIDNVTTTLALIPADAAHTGGLTVSGTVGGEHPGGTLVVAEGSVVPAPYTIADASGAYVLFNVQSGSTSIHGYRRGLALEPATVDSSGADVDLAVISEDVEALAVVTGSVNIVNAPGGSATTVVLIPNSVYDEMLERGPVPAGLRAPTPPEAPSVSGGFTIAGVPEGEYHVLAAFENDLLVRDPDTGIAGTSIQQLSVPSSGTAAVPESFKITEALAVYGPGADTPETVAIPPMLRWADDSSEDRYEVVVFDALGNKAWEKLDVPGVSGSGEVSVPYAGPMELGMYYQFRATSIRENPNKTSPISRTEDLRGVFVVGAP
jgi:hypothetical protein